MMPGAMRIGKRCFHLGLRTYVMGIINVTPDSFSDGGLYLDPEAAAARAREIAAEGADLIDIGAESTRPGSAPLPASIELQRLLPALRAVRAAVDLPISVDTYKAVVAEAALRAGADLINDVTGLRADPGLAAIVADAGVPLILMHQGSYAGAGPEELWTEIIHDLAESMALAVSAGVPRDRLIVDPGFGFGKADNENLSLVTGLHRLRPLGCPILIGPSRKRTLGELIGVDVDDRLEATAAAVTLAIASGADFVRVHDVRSMVRVARVADAATRSPAATPLLLGG